MPRRKLSQSEVPWEIVHHEKAAPQQVFAQALRLRFREGPRLNLDGVHKGKVEDVVVVEIDDLLIASCIDPGEPPESFEKYDVGFRVVSGPGAAAAESESAKTAAERGVA